MSTVESSTATRSIVVENELPYPPKSVWRALAEPEWLARWLMPNDFRAAVGHEFMFRAPAMQGWDGVIECEVLTIEPEKGVSYSWKGGPAASTLDTVVTWTLAPSATGTTLKLQHTGFTELNGMAYESMTKGWQGKLTRQLTEVLSALE